MRFRLAVVSREHVSVGVQLGVAEIGHVGRIADDEIWQAEEGSFKPWRRRVDYDARAQDAQLYCVRDRLQLTSAPNWGYQLRRGLIELSHEDFSTISAAMRNA